MIIRLPRAYRHECRFRQNLVARHYRRRRMPRRTPTLPRHIVRLRRFIVEAFRMLYATGRLKVTYRRAGVGRFEVPLAVMSVATSASPLSDGHTGRHRSWGLPAHTDTMTPAHGKGFVRVV